MGPRCSHAYPSQREGGRWRALWERKGGNSVTTEAEPGGMWSRVRNAGNHQKPEKAMDRFPRDPSEGAQPCWHHEFELLGSRTVRGPISLVRSHPICGDWLKRPRETTQWANIKVPAKLFLLEDPQENIPLPFPPARGCRHSLAYGPALTGPHRQTM